MAKDENMIESNMINFENLSTVWNNKKNKPRGHKPGRGRRLASQPRPRPSPHDRSMLVSALRLRYPSAVPSGAAQICRRIPKDEGEHRRDGDSDGAAAGAALNLPRPP